MVELQIGLKGIEEVTVQRHHLASVWGNVGGSVLSTHQVVLLMEKAARKAVEGRLEKGVMTVGTRVDIKHLAAAPVGARVRAEGRLREVKDRTLVFDVVAYDEYEKLAEGTNEQAIISAKRFLERIQRKQMQISIEGDKSNMMFWL